MFLFLGSSRPSWPLWRPSLFQPRPCDETSWGHSHASDFRRDLRRDGRMGQGHEEDHGRGQGHSGWVFMNNAEFFDHQK